MKRVCDKKTNSCDTSEKQDTAQRYEQITMKQSVNKEPENDIESHSNTANEPKKVPSLELVSKDIPKEDQLHLKVKYFEPRLQAKDVSVGDTVTLLRADQQNKWTKNV